MSVLIYNKIKNIFKDNTFNSTFNFNDIRRITSEYNLTEIERTLTVYELNSNAGSFDKDSCIRFSQICLCRELFNSISRGEVELDSDIHNCLNDVVSAIYSIEDLAMSKGYSACGLPPKYSPGFVGRLFSETNLLCSCLEDNGVYVKLKLVEVYKLLDDM